MSIDNLEDIALKQFDITGEQLHNMIQACHDFFVKQLLARNGEYSEILIVNELGKIDPSHRMKTQNQTFSINEISPALLALTGVSEIMDNDLSTEQALQLLKLVARHKYLKILINQQEITTTTEGQEKTDCIHYTVTAENIPDDIRRDFYNRAIFEDTILYDESEIIAFDNRGIMIVSGTLSKLFSQMGSSLTKKNLLHLIKDFDDRYTGKRKVTVDTRENEIHLTIAPIGQ